MQGADAKGRMRRARLLGTVSIDSAPPLSSTQRQTAYLPTSFDVGAKSGALHPSRLCHTGKSTCRSAKSALHFFSAFGQPRPGLERARTSPWQLLFVIVLGGATTHSPFPSESLFVLI
jgi:hypothetical protein